MTISTPAQLLAAINALPWTNGTGQLTGAEIQALMLGIENLFSTYSGQIANGTTNQLGFYASNGNELSGLNLGTGLSITGNTLNASGNGTVNSGAAGDLAYYATTGTAVSQLALGTGLSITPGSPPTLNSSAVSPIASFATYFAAQQVIIPSNVTSITTLGYYTQGDGGAGTYAYSATPTQQQDGNPGFVTGVPVSVFLSLFGQPNYSQYPLYYQIIGGVLAIVIICSRTSGFVPSSVTDSSGNNYTLAASAGGGGTYVRPVSIWYCANPIAVQIGGTINVSGDPQGLSVYAWSMPGFTNAVLDQTATYTKDNYNGVGGATLTTGAVASTPELVFAVVGGSADPALQQPFLTSFSPGPGNWLELAPTGVTNQNAFLCDVDNAGGAFTFSPSWYWNGASQISPLAIALVTFKNFQQTALTPAYWNLLPSYPPHTSQSGVNPALPDNSLTFQDFNSYLASIPLPSRTLPVTFSNSGTGTAAIVSYSGPWGGHDLSDGAIVSFGVSAGGSLPVDSSTGQQLVAGQFYYVQHPSKTPISATAFGLSYTSVLNNEGDYATTQAAGTTVNTNGSGTGSGTITMTIYGESTFEYVLDPGIYNVLMNAGGQTTTYGMGIGYKKLRVKGYGATFATFAFFSAHPTIDVNSSIGHNYAYRALFQTTNPRANGGPLKQVTLVTASQAANFYVNGWALLMCYEQQGSYSGPPNQAYFEYARIQSVNTSTGVITFYDNLKNNYRSTFPAYADQAYPGAIAPTGPATITMLTAVFDQEVEIFGVTFLNPNPGNSSEEETDGVRLLRLVDCKIFGPTNSGEAGPVPSNMRKWVLERCHWFGEAIEIDKLIEEIYMIDCVFEQNAYPTFQSASTTKMVFERCRMHAVIGTSKESTFRDCIMYNLQLAPVYGSTERIVIENSLISSITVLYSGQWVLVSAITFSNGTIKVAPGVATGFSTWQGNNQVGQCPIPWARPGARAMLSFLSSSSQYLTANGFSISTTNYQLGSPFAVIDTYPDAAGSTANFCVDTTLSQIPVLSFTFTATLNSNNQMVVTAYGQSGAIILSGMNISGTGIPANTYVTGGSPRIPNAAGNLATFTLNNNATLSGSETLTASFPLSIQPFACPRLTVINSGGCQFLSDQAGAPPDIPIWSYVNRAFFGFPQNSNFPYLLELMGSVTSITINVRKAYTGGQSSYTCALTLFGFQSYNGGANVYPIWQTLTIDLKTAGTRVITANGFTGSAGADSIAAVPFWITGQHVVYVGPNYSGGDTLAEMPQWSIVGICDQGGDYGTLSATSQPSYPTNFDTLADTMMGAVTP